MKKEAFSPWVVAGMVVVGLGCFGGFAVLFAFTGGRSARDGGTHALSRSAVGFAGVADLLKASGAPVVLSRDPRGLESTRAGLLVLTPGAGARGPKHLLDSEDQTIMLVLPKWRTRPDGEHAGWVEARGLLPQKDVLQALPADWARPELGRAGPGEHAELAPGMTGPALEPVDRLQTLAGKGWEPILLTKQGKAVMARHLDDGVVVLADPDVLNNQAMASLDRASAAAALLTDYADGDAVTFDLSLNGFGRSRNLLRLIFEPPLLGATLCAVAASLLAGLLASRRFGPPALPAQVFQPGKGQLAANAASLIARAGREGRMGGPYAELSRRLVAQALRVPRRLAGPELDAALDRASAAHGLPAWSGLMAEAGSVRDRAALMRVASRLYEWRTGFR